MYKSKLLIGLIILFFSSLSSAENKILGTYGGFDLRNRLDKGVKVNEKDTGIDHLCDANNRASDLDCLIDEIIASNSNTYYYHFSANTSDHWNYFEAFLTELHQRKASVSVIAYLAPERWLLPFASYKKIPNDPNNPIELDDPRLQWCNGDDFTTAEDSRKNCYATDLVIWANQISNLKTKLDTAGIHNLIGIGIDDYDRVMESPCRNDTGDMRLDYDCTYNPTTIDLEYTQRIKSASGGLLFMPTMYFRDYTMMRQAAAFSPYIDGITFPVLFNESKPSDNPSWSNLLVQTDNLPDQIKYLKEQFGMSKKIVPLLYATGYSGDINTTPEYLLEAGEKSAALADGVIMYHQQNQYVADTWPTEAYMWKEKRALTKSMFARLAGQGSSLNIGSFNYVEQAGTDYFHNAPWFVSGTLPDSSSLMFSVAGNFEPSKVEDELIAIYNAGSNASFYSLNMSTTDPEFGVSDFTVHTQALTVNDVTPAPQPSEIQFALSGKFFDGSSEQLLTFYDYASGQQDIVEYTKNSGSLTARNVYSTTTFNFNFDSMKFAVAGHFVDSTHTSVATLYQYPAAQRIWGFVKNASDTLSPVNWNLNYLPETEVDFDNILYAVAGNFTGDDRDELALIVSENGRAKIYLYGLVNNQMQKLGNAWFDQPESSYNFNFVAHVSAGNFDGDSYDELLLDYDYSWIGTHAIWVFDSNGSDSFSTKYSSLGSKWKEISGLPPKKLVPGEFVFKQNEYPTSVIQFN